MRRRMLNEDQVLNDILPFFRKVFEKKVERGYSYAVYKQSWLNKIELTRNSREEAMSFRTPKKLQEFIRNRHPNVEIESLLPKTDYSKQALDILPPPKKTLGLLMK